MRAMVLEKPGPVEQSPLILDEVTLPLPRAGEVRVPVSVWSEGEVWTEEEA